MQAANTGMPSRADNPDLDWSQVRETILMLNLAVAQIELSLRNGNDSVTCLGDSFTAMAGDVEMIRAAADALPDCVSTDTISERCSRVSEQMQDAIIAFQFYDKMTQRLSHLSNSMAALATLVNTPTELYNPYAWRSLQDKIKSTYTVPSDIAMFEAILTGCSVEDALKASEQATQERQDDDDIELF